MKLTFIIPTIIDGGAERVLINLVNAIVSSKKKYAIHLIYLKSEGQLIKELNEKVKVYNFNRDRARNSLHDIVNYLRKEKPNYFISLLDYMNIISSFAHKICNSQSKLILWEHSHLTTHSKKTISRFQFLNKILIYLTYSRAEKIIAVSEGIGEDLIRNFNLPEKTVKVIENAVFSKNIIEDSKKNHRELLNFKNKYIVSIGRLVKEKNYLNLISAYKVLKDSNKVNGYDLIIVGDGPEKHTLMDFIKANKLEDCVRLVGFMINPYPWIKHASVFVLSSDNEGLPTVLIEALALKKQIVSTDCPSGPNEILDNGKYGVLVQKNNPLELAKGIYCIISKKIIFAEHNLIKRAKYYSIDNSFEKFITLLGLD